MDVISYERLYWLLLLVPLAAALALSLVQRSRTLKWAAFGLRCVAVALIILALCQPFLPRAVHDAHVIFLIDTSESVDPDQCTEAVEQARALIDSLGPGDSWSFMQFATDLLQTDPDTLAEQLTQRAPDHMGAPATSQSRISRALLNARMAFPAGKAKRIVLLTDGRETSGDVARAMQILRDESVDLRLHPLRSVTYPEVSLASVQPNTTSAYLGEKVRLTATITSNRNTPAVLKVYCRGVLEGETTVTLTADEDTTAHIDVVMSTPGAAAWTAQIAAKEDHFPLNNRVTTTIDARGKAKLLVLHEQPRLMRPLARALDHQGIAADVRGVRGLPQTLQGILQFDAVLLANMPATALTTRQMMKLQSYVSDFGGGLLMLGSENSFGLGGYYQTPVEEVLPIVSRYEKEKERPSLAMVLVIDKSGSMEGMPIALARQAAKASVELLSPQDRIAVVAFDGEPRVVCEMRSAGETDLICEGIDRIAAGGGTNMHPAMEQGFQLLEASHSRIKHMIVLGDGQSMPGAFIELAGAMAESSMTVTTVALGDGADRQLMQEIARAGQGRYYETMDPANVPRIFTKETVEASRSAIREEPFLPVRVGQADMLGGIDFDAIPLLLGYVMTRAKPTAQVQLVTEAGDPLLATGRYGLGRSVAFTSDAADRWASQWVQWDGFGQFWAQVLRSCLRKSDSTGVDVKRSTTPERVRFVLSSTGPNGEPADEESWQGLLVDDSGGRTTPEVTQVGLGLYQVDVPRAHTGRFTLRLVESTSDKIKILHHHEDYPAEYRLAGAMDAALAELPPLPGIDAAAELPVIATRRPVRNHLLLAAMACLIAGIALRRV